VEQRHQRLAIAGHRCHAEQTLDQPGRWFRAAIAEHNVKGRFQVLGVQAAQHCRGEVAVLRPCKSELTERAAGTGIFPFSQRVGQLQANLRVLVVLQLQESCAQLGSESTLTQTDGMTSYSWMNIA